MLKYWKSECQNKKVREDEELPCGEKARSSYIQSSVQATLRERLTSDHMCTRAYLKPISVDLQSADQTPSCILPLHDGSR